MRLIKQTFLLTVLMSMVGANVCAHSIAVQNSNGKTIYYNYINNRTELEVTYQGTTYESYNYEYSGSIFIPNEVTYMGVTRKVTSIGEEAFRGCVQLTSVFIPNSVTSIGNSAFHDCGLISLTIGINVKTIGNSAFCNCSGLTSVTIPNSVTSIGYNAFYYCSQLSSITIGNSVKSIGYNAFYWCPSLKYVIVSDIAAWCGITFSSEYSNPVSFAHHIYSDYYTEIKDLVIPSGVTTIGNYAFSGCLNLTSVSIPNSVTTIGEKAFNFTNSSGKKVEITSLIDDPQNISGYAFSTDLYNNALLYIPIGTLSKYKACTGWKEFVNIEEKEMTDIKIISSDNTSVINRYTLDGKRVSMPQKGVNFVRMNNGTTKKVVVK